jgi:hypothetical protein
MTNTANSAGAMSEVRTRNREALYQLSKQLQKAAKKIVNSSPADVDRVTLHPAQLEQAAAEQPAEAAAAPAAPAAAAGAAALSGAGAKRAAKKALNRMARSSTAADPAAEADELAHTILSAAPAVQPEASAEADVPAMPTPAKKAKRRKQQASSQNVLTLPGANGGAELAKAGARASAKSHRTRSATGAHAAAPPGDDATPGRCFKHGFIMGMCRAQAWLQQPHDPLYCWYLKLMLCSDIAGGAAVNGKRLVATRLADDSAAAGSAERKSVHFRLKHNLHFAYGGALLICIFLIGPVAVLHWTTLHAHMHACRAGAITRGQDTARSEAQGSRPF